MCRQQEKRISNWTYVVDDVVGELETPKERMVGGLPLNNPHFMTSFWGSIIKLLTVHLLGLYDLSYD